MDEKPQDKADTTSQPTWNFHSDQSAQLPPSDTSAQPGNQQPPRDDAAVVSWTASEYIAHHKGFNWYVLYAVVSAVITLIVFLFTRDMVSAVFIALIAVIFAIIAGRKPRVLTYQLDRRGLAIGNKFYPYSTFKSFSLSEQDTFSSVTLLPLGRFMPPISIYFAPEDESRIIETLALYLPMDRSSGETLDRLMNRLRF